MFDIGTGPDGCGITFGSLADGIVVAQRHLGMWSDSSRPNPDGTGMRYYTDPAVVARVVIACEHDETAAVKPPRPARAFLCWPSGSRSSASFLPSILKCSAARFAGAAPAT